MRVDTLKVYSQRHLRLAPAVAGLDPQVLQAGRALIRAHRELDLRLPEAAALGLRVLIPALLAHSLENRFIKFDPWHESILVKRFPGSRILYQYNPYRDPANRQASGQKNAPPQPGGKPPDFLAWETFPENEFFLIWTASSGQRYGILVQPVPIVPDHLIVASLDRDPVTGNHDEQVMKPGRLSDMNELLGQLAPLGYAMGFNGRHAGASVDHFHTQAVPRAFLPLIHLLESRQVCFSQSRHVGNHLWARLLASRSAGWWGRWRRQQPYPADAILLEAREPGVLHECEKKILAYFDHAQMTYNSIAWQSRQNAFCEVFFPRAQEAILNQTLKAGYVEMSGMLVIPAKMIFDQVQPGQGEKGIREAGPVSQISSHLYHHLLTP